MIRKNDTVMVITGKNKGKTGKVLSILLDTGRVVVEKISTVKRHQKPNQKMPQGGIVDKNASIAISNVMVYCSKCSKGVRVGAKIDAKGNKKRVCKKCDSNLEQ